MVDIKDSPILTTGLNEKNDTVTDVVNGSYMDDDMDNLAYSDSESASIAMADDEFCDALDHLVSADPNTQSKENGEQIVGHENDSDKRGDSPMQTDNNEEVDERNENVNEAATDNATANCDDDGSSTKVQSDETVEAANDLADDENAATVESPVDDKLNADNKECDVDMPLNVSDSGIAKETATDMDSSIVADADLKREDVLCNGITEEKQTPNDGNDDGDGDNSIEMSTSNGEALTENVDSNDADINFDQIFDRDFFENAVSNKHV